MNTLNNLTFLMSQIFDDQYSVGQGGLIEWLRQNVGMVVCWVISAVGFLIVSAAIIKNALAGLYLAFPKLWNKVYEVRQKAEQSATSMAGGEKGKKMIGGFLVLFLSILPDVKSATEFGEDSEGGQSGSVDGFTKKRWLTKAIPEFVALTMIGMLIWFGYPTKLTNWIGETGRFALDAFFDNVDPVQLTKKVFDGIATYELATDNATSSYEQNVNAMTRQAMKQVYTKYSDMHQQPLQQVALDIENRFLQDFVEEEDLLALLSEQDGMTVSFAVQLTATQPALSEAFKGGKSEKIHNLYAAKSSSGVQQYKYFFPTSELPTGSQKVGTTDYILVTVNATPKSQTVVSTSKASFFVKSASLSTAMSGNNSKFNIPGPVVFNTSNDLGIYTMNGGVVTLQTFNADGSLIKTFSGKIFTEGNTGSIEMTSTAFGNLSGELAKSAYVEVLLPPSSYTMYQTETNGVTVNTRVSVYAIRFMAGSNTTSSADGWINTNWLDYKKADVTTSKTLTQSFFENKSSTGTVE